MLKIKHVRNGKALTYNWGWHHFAAIMDAVEAEGARPNGSELIGYTFKQHHEMAVAGEPKDMVIEPGDEMHWWR